MEHKGHNEQEDDVYGGDVPDEAYMDADYDAEVEADADDSLKAKVFFNLYVCILYVYMHLIYKLTGV